MVSNEQLFRPFQALSCFAFFVRIVMCPSFARQHYWLKIYSNGNPTNIANPINDVSFQLDIKTVSGRLTLYQTTLCEKLSWDDFNVNVDVDPEGYMSSYDVNDIQVVCCQDDASTMWLVPDVVQKQLIRSLKQFIVLLTAVAWI